jgi:hypothetical protein
MLQSDVLWSSVSDKVQEKHFLIVAGDKKRANNFSIRPKKRKFANEEGKQV